MRSEHERGPEAQGEIHRQPDTEKPGNVEALARDGPRMSVAMSKSSLVARKSPRGGE